MSTSVLGIDIAKQRFKAALFVNCSAKSLYHTFLNFYPVYAALQFSFSLYSKRAYKLKGVSSPLAYNISTKNAKMERGTTYQDKIIVTTSL